MQTSERLRILGVDCSPSGPGNTALAIQTVLDASREAGAEVRLVHLGGDEAAPVAEAVDALHEADAFVFGSPMYRASYAWPFKRLLDETPRGLWGEATAPLAARATAIVGTAATFHHFLGMDSMRNVLVDFFASHVLSPGLYVPRDGFGEDALLDPYGERARVQGLALVELAGAISASAALGSVEPQA